MDVISNKDGDLSLVMDELLTFIFDDHNDDDGDGPSCMWQGITSVDSHDFMQTPIPTSISAALRIRDWYIKEYMDGKTECLCGFQFCINSSVDYACENPEAFDKLCSHQTHDSICMWTKNSTEQKIEIGPKEYMKKQFYDKCDCHDGSESDISMDVILCNERKCKKCTVNFARIDACKCESHSPLIKSASKVS
jgi:hypothetical protein